MPGKTFACLGRLRGHRRTRREPGPAGDIAAKTLCFDEWNGRQWSYWCSDLFAGKAGVLDEACRRCHFTMEVLWYELPTVSIWIMSR